MRIGSPTTGKFLQIRWTVHERLTYQGNWHGRILLVLCSPIWPEGSELSIWNMSGEKELKWEVSVTPYNPITLLPGQWRGLWAHPPLFERRYKLPRAILFSVGMIRQNCFDDRAILFSVRMRNRAVLFSVRMRNRAVLFSVRMRNRDVLFSVRMRNRAVLFSIGYYITILCGKKSWRV